MIFTLYGRPNNVIDLYLCFIVVMVSILEILLVDDDRLLFERFIANTKQICVYVQATTT